MIVIGIDSSLDGTVVASGFIDGKMESVYSVNFSVPKLSEACKLYEIYSKIKQMIISTHKLFPEKKVIIFLEDVAFGVKHFRASSGMVQGVIRLLLVEMNQQIGIRVFLVPPTTLKKFVTTQGNAKKEDMKLCCYKLWGKEYKTNNEVDAYCLMKMGKYYLNSTTQKELSVKRQEALKKIYEYPLL